MELTEANFSQQAILRNSKNKQVRERHVPPPEERRSY